MIAITADVVRDGLTAIVEEVGGDFIYTPVPKSDDPEDGTKCVYVHNGAPSCIVGRFLANLGVPIERLEDADSAHGDGGEPAEDLLYSLEREDLLTLSENVVSALSAAQSAQDLGVLYVDVLARAKRRLND